MTQETVVKVGEYEVRHTNGADFHALRHGDRWRELAGDNLVLALVTRVEQLERAFTDPTPEMVQAGLAEVQRWLEEHADVQMERGGDAYAGNINPDDTTDDDASDLAVFVLQAMADKLPKAGE